MGRLLTDSDGLTAAQLRQLAEAKLQQAASTADQNRKRSLLELAEALKAQAEIKGWINSELRPPD